MTLRANELRMTPKHELKTWPEYFCLVWDGLKQFEVRKNDRHFQEGDSVLLKEWSSISGYTGRQIMVTITYVFRGGELGGLMPGYVVFGFEENYRSLKNLLNYPS